MAAKNKSTGSIDDITPQEWDEMNRRHLEEKKRKQTQESERLSGETLFYSDEGTTFVTDNDYQITLDPEYEVNVPSFTIGNDMSIEYKYSEDRLIDELKTYVDNTYGEHYSRNKYQATEFIIDGGHGMGFCLGNILKYAQRYGHKGGYNRKDLLKVLHYALIALHVHDTEDGNTTNER